MGVQSFNSSVNGVGFNYNVVPTTSKVNSFNIDNIEPKAFTPTIKTNKAKPTEFTVTSEESKAEIKLKTVIASSVQVGAHFTASFASVFEEVIDGVAIVLGEGVIWTSRFSNWAFDADIDTEKMEHNLMEYAATDYSKKYISDAVDNSQFVQDYSTATDVELAGAEVAGSIVGNAVLYTVGNGTGFGIAASALGGVGKGFGKAAAEGASFEQATVNGAIHGVVAGVTKYGVGKVGGVAKDAVSASANTATTFTGKIVDVGTKAGGYMAAGAGIGFTGSIAKNVSNYAVYAKDTVGDDGNLKYGSYGKYFKDSGALSSAIGSGASAAISVGFGAYNKAYGQKTTNKMEEMQKQANKYLIKEPSKAAPKLLKATKKTADYVTSGSNNNNHHTSSGVNNFAKQILVSGKNP